MQICHVNASPRSTQVLDSQNLRFSKVWAKLSGRTPAPNNGKERMGRWGLEQLNGLDVGKKISTEGRKGARSSL